MLFVEDLGSWYDARSEVCSVGLAVRELCERKRTVPGIGSAGGRAFRMGPGAAKRLRRAIRLVEPSAPKRPAVCCRSPAAGGGMRH